MVFKRHMFVIQNLEKLKFWKEDLLKNLFWMSAQPASHIIIVGLTNRSDEMAKNKINNEQISKLMSKFCLTLKSYTVYDIMKILDRRCADFKDILFERNVYDYFLFVCAILSKKTLGDGESATRCNAKTDIQTANAIIKQHWDAKGAIKISQAAIVRQTRLLHHQRLDILFRQVQKLQDYPMLILLIHFKLQHGNEDDYISEVDVSDEFILSIVVNN